MAHSSDKTFAVCTTSADSVWHKAAAAYLQHLQDNLSQYNQVHRQFLRTCSQLSQRNAAVETYWQGLEKHEKKLLEWTKSIDFMSADGSQEAIWGTWQQEMKRHHSAEPAVLVLQLIATFWQKRAGDGLYARIGKWTARWRDRLRSFANRSGNVLRRLIRRPALLLAPRTRTVAWHDFLTYYIELPVAELLFDEWQRFLQQGLRQTQQLHNLAEDVSRDLLFLEQFAQVCLERPPSEISAEVRALLKQLRPIDSLAESIDHYRQESAARVADGLAAILSSAQRHFAVAGTFQLPNRKYGSRRIEQKRRQLDDIYARNHRRWQQAFTEEFQGWQKDLELDILQSRSAIICKTSLDLLQHRIREKLIPVYKQSSQGILAAKEKFGNNETRQKASMRKLINTEQQAMIRYLRNERIPLMTDSLHAAELERIFSDFIAEQHQAIDQLPDVQIIAREWDVSRIPPKSVVDEIRLKELVKDEIFDGKLAELEKVRQNIRGKLERLLREISEVDQIVEFNLEAAQALLAPGEGDADAVTQAQRVVIEGLERAINKIDDLVEQYDGVQTAGQAGLTDITARMENDLQALADNEKILEIKFRLAKAKAQARLRGYYTTAGQFLLRLLPRIWEGIKQRYSQLRSNYLRLQKIAGLAPAADAISEEVFQYLLETKNKIRAMPFVYQRLFRMEPLLDARFFTNRTQEIEMLRQGLRTWQSQQFAALVLVGEKGCGRTTLLNFAEEQIFKGITLHRATIEETISTEAQLLSFLTGFFNEKNAQSIDELEQIIGKREDGVVCMLEDIQRMFLRTIDGFDAIERFLLFISRTNVQVFWIVTCTLYAWEYLQKVVVISDYFRRVIDMSELAKDEIQEIILQRHRVSGYWLHFETPPRIASNRTFKKLPTDEAQQEYLQNLFFGQLHEVARGNVSIALFFWLRAIKSFAEDHLVISPLIEFDSGFLNRLSSEKLFTLAAFLQHDMLTPAQHATIFYQPENKSLLLLQSMADDGILVRRSHGFVINRFLYRHIVRTLRSKNILY